jgi:hypothetical protein
MTTKAYALILAALALGGCMADGDPVNTQSEIEATLDQDIDGDTEDGT